MSVDSAQAVTWRALVTMNASDNATAQPLTAFETRDINNSRFKYLSQVRHASAAADLWFILDVYVTSVICLIGITGNSLAMAVLRRDRLQHGTRISNWLLSSLAVVDTLFLVLKLTLMVRPICDKLNWHLDWLHWCDWFPQLFIWPTTGAVHTMTIWAVLFITADRYIAIARPFVWRKRTSRRVKMTFIVVCLLAIVYCTPLYFEKIVIELTDCTTGEVGAQFSAR
jgi:hypothetical protein